MYVPEKRIPYFKPGKELKDLINAAPAPQQSVDGDPFGEA